MVKGGGVVEDDDVACVLQGPFCVFLLLSFGLARLFFCVGVGYKRERHQHANSRVCVGLHITYTHVITCGISDLPGQPPASRQFMPPDLRYTG